MFETQSPTSSYAAEIGALISKARQFAGKTSKECANLLGISVKRYEQVENGQLFLSLPEIESLAYFFGVLPQVLLGEEPLKEKTSRLNPEQLQQLIQIRQRIIAATIQLARTQKGLSLKNLAETTKISAARLKRYERLATTIPLNEMHAITAALDISFPSLFNKAGPLADWLKDQKKWEAFCELPEALQDFITTPENRKFLELAMRLKETGIQNLEGLTASLQQLIETTKI